MNDKEKVAQWMIERGLATGHGDSIEDLLKELEWQIESRTKQSYCYGVESGIDAERERIVNVLMTQHDAAKGRHNYWQVAANLIQAER